MEEKRHVTATSSELSITCDKNSALASSKHTHLNSSDGTVRKDVKDVKDLKLQMLDPDLERWHGKVLINKSNFCSLQTS